MTRKQSSDDTRFRGVLDIVNVELTGSNLIEASAGTGKTHAITGLYLRLLIETGLSVADILVVTYTVAATNELIERIRGRLKAALQAFKNLKSDDDFLSKLLEKFSDSRSRLAAIGRLKKALGEFDEAAIHTIHAFCRRALVDHAFESGELFSTELITDDQEIRRELVEDFWRTHFYSASPAFVSYALGKNLNPENLLQFANKGRFAGQIKIVPDDEVSSPESEEKLISELRQSLDKLRSLWITFRPEAEKFLFDPSLNKQIYGSKSSNIIEEMDAYLSVEPPALFPGPFFEKFSADYIQRKTLRGFEPPVHPLFDLCKTIWDRSNELKELFERHIVSLYKKLAVWLLEELPKRKQARNVQYFDDLLLRMRGGLLKKGNQRLISALRSRYRAALIDEFQDTDPIQYEIIAKIFQPPGTVLFLIGDPKQAIYSFRGADIFAYLTAAKDVEHIYTLDKNWRSDPLLITAFNTLFSLRENPFVFPEIPYRKISRAEKPFTERFTLDGQFQEPMHCWVIDTNGPISRETARNDIATTTAAEIAGLISAGKLGTAKIGERLLRPNDIAIIVRTNNEAILCKNALERLQVPSVLNTAESLFASREALEMERFLRAVYLPERDDLMLAALATDMIGKDLSYLYSFQRDETLWEEWKEKFSRYHELWDKKGFLTMFRFFLDREEIRERLISLPGGERRLTNLLGLGELLQKEAEQKNSAMGAVIKWLVEQIEHPPNDEEYQQRLETDSEAVKIVTIHKSKGLQYPVVFCPFLWDGFKKPEAPFFYHDEHMAGILDLSSANSEAARTQATETLAEEIRLFYVALTRAKSACTFVWGAINQSGTSAPAYLFHGEKERGDIVAETEAAYKKLTAKEIYTRMVEIAEKSRGSIRTIKMPGINHAPAPPVPADNVSVHCHEFKGSIDNSWHVASFSYLTGSETPYQEYPDRDAVTEFYPLNPEPENAQNRMDDPVLSFPAGARSGILLHEVLEKTDFTGIEAAATSEMVDRKLGENGFAPELKAAVLTMLKRVVDHPLAVGSALFARSDAINETGTATKTARPIYLHEIPPTNRLNELEFYFPLKHLSSEKLYRILAESGLSAGNSAQRDFTKRRLCFDTVHGFMKGFIDMVFCWRGLWFLVDWKSNFLGSGKENYHREALKDVMAFHHYGLQYILYLLALHSYLKLRQPGYDYSRHFGGVFYLFLRGMNPAWGEDYGVFFDRPDPAQIEFLCNEMIEPCQKK